MGDSANVETLLEIVRNYQGLRISTTDLHKLSTDTVVSIYVEFIRSFGIDARNLKNPLNSETQFHLSHYDPDLRFIMKLYAVMNTIFKESGAFEFDLMDILRPGLARTASIAKILHNIILFKSSRKETIDETVKEGSEKIEKFRRMTALKDKLRHEINFQSKQKAELLMQRDQLKKQLSEAEERVFIAIEEKQNTTESIQHATKTLADKGHEISKLEAEANKLSQTIEKLKNQIVSSPEQLIKNLGNLKEKEQELKEEEQNVGERIQQKKSHCEKLTLCAHLAKAVREEIKDLNKLIDDIRNEEMLVVQLETEKTNLKETVSSKQDEMKLVRNTEVEHQQKIESLKEQLSDKNEKAQKKIKEIEKVCEKLLNSMNETQRKVTDRTKQLEECKCKITREQNTQTGILLEIGNESQNVVKEVEMLIDSFNHFRQTLAELEGNKK